VCRQSKRYVCIDTVLQHGILRIQPFSIGDGDMIFIILGTQKFQMNRLLILVDDLIADGELSTAVVAQIGQSDYEPKHFSFYRFLDKHDFDRLVSDASIIITHGGVSSIITAIKCGKPVVVFPRLKKYGEHVDNHQREIAHVFEKKGFVICCDEGDDFMAKVALAKAKEFYRYVSQTDNISQIINDYLARHF